MKTCSKCQQKLPFTSFSKYAAAKDGFQAQCKPCKAEYQINWQRANREKQRALRRDFYNANRDREIANVKAWQRANREKLISTKRERYKANREYNLKKIKEWKRANPDRANAQTALRRATRRNATPPWLTLGDKAEIEGLYQFAQIMSQLTGIEHHVDHIFPLKGDGFTGLHVPWNLRVVPAATNLSKRNRFPEEYADLAWFTQPLA